MPVALLKKYCDWFYKQKKSEFEEQFLEYRVLNEDDPNFVHEYRFLVEESATDIISKLENLKTLIEKGELQAFEYRGLHSIIFDKHLYQPLIHIYQNNLVEVKPVELNEGEKTFIADLKQFCQAETEFFQDKEFYLLRNKSKAGIGFFEAGNFYPDFIFWIVTSQKQYITFVDPKGIDRLEKGINNPKIQFFKTIKTLEDRLGDSNMVLNSFILSVTNLMNVSWNPGFSKEQFEDHHVFFQEGGYTSVKKMMSKILQ